MENKSILNEEKGQETSKSFPLATGSVKALFFRLALPAVVAQLVNMLYNMVDRIYIGHLENVGPIALTGVGISSPLLMIISAFAIMIGGGGAPRASILLGAGNKKEADHVVNTAFSTSIIIGLVLTFLTIAFLEPLLKVLGASPEAMPYSLAYTKVYLAGSIFVMLSLGMNKFISVQGFAKEAMVTTLIGAFLNIILDPIFIFWLDFGVAGAAWASILSQAISAIWVIKFLRSPKSHMQLKLQGPKMSVFISIVALGFAPFIMHSTESLLLLVFNRSLFNYGKDLYVATMSINSMVMYMMFLPIIGFSQGAVSLISYNYGARNADRVKEAVKILLITNLTYSFSFACLLQAFPGFFVNLFTKDPALFAATVPTLRIYMAGTFFLGLQVGCQQSFIAFGQARLSTFMALLRKCILLIPMIYIIPNFIKPELYGIYAAEPVSDIIASFITAYAFFRFIRDELEEIRSDQNFDLSDI